MPSPIFSPTERSRLPSSPATGRTVLFRRFLTHPCCRNRSRPQSCTPCSSRSSVRPSNVQLSTDRRNQPSPAAFVGRHEVQTETMTAKQFLLSESLYCRRRAADCADPFLAKELRRLADGFER